MENNVIIKHVNTGTMLVLAVFVGGFQVSRHYTASNTTCVEYAKASGASLLDHLRAIALDDYRRGLWTGGLPH